MLRLWKHESPSWKAGRSLRQRAGRSGSRPPGPRPTGRTVPRRNAGQCRAHGHPLPWAAGGAVDPPWVEHATASCPDCGTLLLGGRVRGSWRQTASTTPMVRAGVTSGVGAAVKAPSTGDLPRSFRWGQRSVNSNRIGAASCWWAWQAGCRTRRLQQDSTCDSSSGRLTDFPKGDSTAIPEVRRYTRLLALPPAPGTAVALAAWSGQARHRSRSWTLPAGAGDGSQPVVYGDELTAGGPTAGYTNGYLCRLPRMEVRYFLRRGQPGQQSRVAIPET